MGNERTKSKDRELRVKNINILKAISKNNYFKKKAEKEHTEAE